MVAGYMYVLLFVVVAVAATIGLLLYMQSSFFPAQSMGETAGNLIIEDAKLSVKHLRGNGVSYVKVYLDISLRNIGSKTIRIDYIMVDDITIAYEENITIGPGKGFHKTFVVGEFYGQDISRWSTGTEHTIKIRYDEIGGKQDMEATMKIRII